MTSMSRAEDAEKRHKGALRHPTMDDPPPTKAVTQTFRAFDPYSTLWNTESPGRAADDSSSGTTIVKRFENMSVVGKPERVYSSFRKGHETLPGRVPE